MYFFFLLPLSQINRWLCAKKSDESTSQSKHALQLVFPRDISLIATDVLPNSPVAF